MNARLDAGLVARLSLGGSDGLSDAELLSLACVLPVTDAQVLLDGLAPRASCARSAVQWQALIALERRRRCAALPARAALSSASAAAALLAPALADLEVEELHALALDSRNRLLRHVVVARGAANQVSVSAREVFRPLISAGAVSAIIAHNHPSGACDPSPEDRQLTARLVAAGQLVGIAVIDHLVLAADGYYSFAEADEVRVITLRARG